MATKPILQISAQLDAQKSKKQIQDQLNKIGDKLTVTIGVDKSGKSEQQLKEYSKRINDIDKAHTLALQKNAQIEEQNYNKSWTIAKRINREMDADAKKRLDAIKNEQSAQDANRKSEEKSLNIEKMKTAEIDKQREKIALFQAEMERKSAKLLAGQYGGRVDTSALESLKSKVSGLSVDPDNLRASTTEMNNLNSRFKDISTNAQLASRGIKGFGEDLGKNLTKFSEWMIASSIFYGAFASLQSGIQTIRDFDKAMTELKKVSEDSNATLDEFGKTAEIIGAKVGRTSTEVVNATADFVKMGYTLKQSALLAKDALILTNVGDGFKDVGEASEALVTTLKGFNLNASESTHIIDSLNELSNKYAVNSVDLAEALKRSSAVMAQSGNTLDETLALYTAGIEVLQSPEKVSRGISTISQRLRGLSDDGEKLAGLTPKLQEAFNLYGKGVKITADDGTLRSTYDILSDLSKVWGTLNDKQQQYLGELIAGKDQIKVLASLLQNQKVLFEANTVSLESNGSAMKENAVFMQSLEGRVRDFNRAMENLWKNTINSESIKQLVSFGTGLVNVADSIGLLNLALTTLGSTLLIKYMPLMTEAIQLLITFKLESLTLIPALTLLNAGIVVLAGSWLLLSYRHSQFIKSQDLAIQKLNDANETSKQNVDTTHRLVESIMDLNGVQKLNAEQQGRLGSVIKEIQKLYPNMFNNLDKEKDKVNALVTAYNAVAKSALASQVARAQAEVSSAQSAYDAIAEKAKLSSGQGRTAQANARFGLGAVDYTQDTSAKAILERKKKAEAILKQAQSDLSNYKPLTAKDFEQSSGSAGGGTNSGVSGGTSGTKSQKDPYLSSLNLQYQELERQISLTNQALKDNQNKLSNTTNEQEKINLLKSEIELNKKLQSQYAEIAKAKRNEMKAIQSQLNALGLGVSIDKEDNVIVKNWKNINKLSEDNRKLADDLIGKIQSLSGEVQGYGDSWSDVNNKIIADNKQITDTLKEQREEKLKQLTEIENLVSDMIKQGYKDDIDKAKDLIDKAKEQLDIRLKQLEAEKELADFNKDRAKSEKEINQISSKMASLQTAVSQGDAKAKTEYDKLADEKLKLQESLDDKINERGFDLTKDRLQNEYDLFEKTKKDEIDSLEDQLNNAENISKKTYDRINSYISGKSTSLYYDLISWNSKYGSGMDSDIISKWNTAIGLIDTYNSKLNGMGSTSVNYEEYKQGLSTGNDKASIIAQMKANGAQWATASASKKKELNQANIALANSIGYTYDSKTGSYFNAQGAKLYDNGGVKEVGEVGIMASKDRETVLLDPQVIKLVDMGVQKSFSQLANFIPNFANMMTPQFNSLSSSPSINVNINGDVSDSNIGRITDTLKQTVLDVTQGQLNSFKQRGIKPSTRIR